MRLTFHHSLKPFIFSSMLLLLAIPQISSAQFASLYGGFQFGGNLGYPQLGYPQMGIGGPFMSMPSAWRPVNDYNPCSPPYMWSANSMGTQYAPNYQCLYSGAPMGYYAPSMGMQLPPWASMCSFGCGGGRRRGGGGRSSDRDRRIGGGSLGSIAPTPSLSGSNEGGGGGSRESGTALEVNSGGTPSLSEAPSPSGSTPSDDGAAANESTEGMTCTGDQCQPQIVPAAAIAEIALNIRLDQFAERVMDLIYMNCDAHSLIATDKTGRVPLNLNSPDQKLRQYRTAHPYMKEILRMPGPQCSYRTKRPFAVIYRKQDASDGKGPSGPTKNGKKWTLYGSPLQSNKGLSAEGFISATLLAAGRKAEPNDPDDSLPQVEINKFFSSRSLPKCFERVPSSSNMQNGDILIVRGEAAKVFNPSYEVSAMIVTGANGDPFSINAIQNEEACDQIRDTNKFNFNVMQSSSQYGIGVQKNNASQFKSDILAEFGRIACYSKLKESNTVTEKIEKLKTEIENKMVLMRPVDRQECKANSGAPAVFDDEDCIGPLKQCVEEKSDKGS